MQQTLLQLLKTPLSLASTAGVAPSKPRTSMIRIRRLMQQTLLQLLKKPLSLASTASVAPSKPPEQV